MWSVLFVSYFNKNIKRVNDEQREVNILSTFASQEYMYMYDPLCSTTANPWLAKMYFIVN